MRSYPIRVIVAGVAILLALSLLLLLAVQAQARQACDAMAVEEELRQAPSPRASTPLTPAVRQTWVA